MFCIDVSNEHTSISPIEFPAREPRHNRHQLQAWDDHTGESLDAKKVKGAKQLEMEYYDKMHVFDGAYCFNAGTRRP